MTYSRLGIAAIFGAVLLLSSHGECSGFLRVHDGTVDDKVADAQGDEDDASRADQNDAETQEDPDDELVAEDEVVFRRDASTDAANDFEFMGDRGSHLVALTTIRGGQEAEETEAETEAATESDSKDEASDSQNEEDGGDNDDRDAKDSNIHVACEVAGNAVDMLVDTGATTSIISVPLARQLALLSGMDASMQGVANGVGQAQILGRLWNLPVKLGPAEFALSFDVLDMPEPLLLLGGDQLRHFKCIVDMERNRLMLGGEGGVEIPFSSSR